MRNHEKIKKNLMPATALTIGATAIKWGFKMRTDRDAYKNLFETGQETRNAQHAKIQELEGLAREDALTGLKNRRAFDEDLSKQIKMAGRGQKSSLILIDLDKFKSINDAHGHEKGDEVLKGVADILKASGRGYENFYRYGGEELAAIVPETEAGAAVLAERLRAAVENSQFGLGQPVTSSFGVSEINENALYLADKALYAAKDNGRNQVFAAANLPPLTSLTE